MFRRTALSSLSCLLLVAPIVLVACGGSSDVKSNKFATAMVDVISAAKKGSTDSDSQGRTAEDTVKAVLGNDPKACSLFTSDGLRHDFGGSDPGEACREELVDRDSQEIEITGLASDDRETATATATAGSNTWQVDLVKEEDGWRVTTTTRAETATTENGDTTSTQEGASEDTGEPTRTEPTTTASRGDQERASEDIREPTDTQDIQTARPEPSQPGDEGSVSAESGSATRNLHESAKLVDAITETPIEGVGQPITFRALTVPAGIKGRARINKSSDLVLKVESVDKEGVNRDGQKEVEAAYCNPDGTVSFERVKYGFTNIKVSFEYRGQSPSTVSFGAVAYDVDGVLWPDIGRLGRRSSLTNSRPLDKSGNVTTDHRRFQLTPGEKYFAFLTVAVPEGAQLRQVDITPVVVVGENATAFAPITGVWSFPQP